MGEVRARARIHARACGNADGESAPSVAGEGGRGPHPREDGGERVHRRSSEIEEGPRPRPAAPAPGRGRGVIRRRTNGGDGGWPGEVGEGPRPRPHPRPRPRRRGRGEGGGVHRRSSEGEMVCARAGGSRMKAR